MKTNTPMAEMAGRECERLRLLNAELVRVLRECVTERGATCWKSRAYAEQRIWYIDTIARAALARAQEMQS